MLALLTTFIYIFEIYTKTWTGQISGKWLQKLNIPNLLKLYETVQFFLGNSKMIFALHSTPDEFIGVGVGVGVWEVGKGCDKTERCKQNSK